MANQTTLKQTATKKKKERKKHSDYCEDRNTGIGTQHTLSMTNKNIPKQRHKFKVKVYIDRTQTVKQHTNMHIN